MKTSLKTIGILTSGGDAPGLNAVIRAICISASNYGIKVLGFKNGYRGLVQNDYIKMSDVDLTPLLASGGTVLGTSREKPFKATEPDPVTGKMPVDSIRDTFKKDKLDCLFCLGGNGTNTTASLLSDAGFPVIGLPKTIDNDIYGTEMTFGFHTALDVATEGINQIRTTAKSHGRVMVVEIMGHKAGWLALYAGAAAGADVILIPEVPYDIKKVGKAIQKKIEAGQNYAVIACAEGAMDTEEGKLDKKAFKKARAKLTESIAYRVARELEAETGKETRTSVLGYTQRGADPKPYDIVLASQFGQAAVEMAVQKKFGNLVAVIDGKISATPLSEVAGKIKPIPLDNPLLLAERDLGVCFGD